MLHIFKYKTTSSVTVNIAVKQRKCKMASVKWGLLVCFFTSLVQAERVYAIPEVMAGIT